MTEKSALLNHKQRTNEFSDIPPRRAVTVEFGRGVLSSIRLSKWYLAHCACLALLSIVLILLLIFRDHVVPPPPWLAALDGVICFSLLIETSIDLLMLRGSFWKQPWHIFDFVVTFFSILGFVLLVLEMTQTINYTNDAIALLFGAVRYAVQVMRVIRYLLAAHAARQSQTVIEAGGEVTFPPEADIRGPGDISRSFQTSTQSAEDIKKASRGV